MLRARGDVRVGIAIVDRGLTSLPPPAITAMMERALMVIAEDEGGDTPGMLRLESGFVLSGVEGGEPALHAEAAVELALAHWPVDEEGPPPAIDELRAAAARLPPPSVPFDVHPRLTQPYRATRDWFVTRGVEWHDFGTDWARFVDAADHLLLLVGDQSTDVAPLENRARRHGRSVQRFLLRDGTGDVVDWRTLAARTPATARPAEGAGDRGTKRRHAPS